MTEKPLENEEPIYSGLGSDPHMLARIFADDPEAARRISIVELDDDDEIKAVRNLEEIGREIPPDIVDYLTKIFEMPRPGEPPSLDARTITMPTTLMTQSGEEILRLILSSQGPIAYFGVAKGSYPTDPKYIEDTAPELIYDLSEILYAAIPEMNSHGFDALRLSFKDFDFTPEIRLSQLDQLLENIQHDVIRLGLDRYIQPERLWWRAQGDPLNDPKHPEPAYASEVDDLFLWGLSQFLARRLFIKYLSHKGAPCGCGRETWPITYRDPDKGGRPRLCDTMCPPCQVEHERMIERERKMKNRKKSGKPARKRGRPIKSVPLN